MVLDPFATPAQNTILAWDALLSVVAATGPLGCRRFRTGLRYRRLVAEVDVEFGSLRGRRGARGGGPASGQLVAVIARGENVTRSAKGKWPGPDEG